MTRWSSSALKKSIKSAVIFLKSLYIPCISDNKAKCGVMPVKLGVSWVLFQGNLIVASRSILAGIQVKNDEACSLFLIWRCLDKKSSWKQIEAKQKQKYKKYKDLPHLLQPQTFISCHQFSAPTCFALLCLSLKNLIKVVRQQMNDDCNSNMQLCSPSIDHQLFCSE